MALGKREIEFKDRMIKARIRNVDIVRIAAVNYNCFTGWLNGVYNLPEDQKAKVTAVLESLEKKI